MSASLPGLEALGDPTRRAIFEILANEGPCPVGQIAGQLPVTRSAVSQHLKVLTEARLVTHQAMGTKHLYQLDPDGIAALRDYLERLWQNALGGFKRSAERAWREQAQKEKSS